MIKQCCIILTTTNDRQVAEHIATTLLEINLASCIQINDIDSYFKWESKIVSEKEYRLMIKAKVDNYTKIENIIINLHNYELPQIIRLNIDDGLPAYLNWIIQEN